MTNKDPVDIHIGHHLKTVREARRMTLGQLGRELGLTYQQIRKYESGENRLSASRLYRLSQLLHVEPASFFSGLATDDEQDPTTTVDDPALSAALDRIGNPEIRRHLKGLIEILEGDASGTRHGSGSAAGS